MYAPYPENMMESIKKVEATRAQRMATEPRRLTAEEKDALLEKFHPDYNPDAFAEIKVGPNKGQKAPLELAEMLHSTSRLINEKIDLTKIDYDVDVLVIGGGGAGSSCAIEAHNAGADVMIVTKLRIGDANTMMAEGGIQAADKENDSPVQHYLDCFGGGHFAAKPELVKRLFESEVTEIKDGTVEIKSIAREAGSRTKIAVWSNNPNVDAVGACVGMNGARVNAIVNELRGEKIDIITWDENPALLIENALSPAKVISVIADADEKSAKVVVPDYQLSLAIGKEGQNARLAARLTGFKIDIKSETQARESGDFMDYENDYEEDDYDDDYDYSDDELAENERLADTEQADVQAEAFDTEADENEAAGTENDAADSGDEQ